MKLILKALISIVIVALVGCVHVQPDVNVAPDFWQAKNKSIGIFLMSNNKPGFHMEGDVRLLDYAVNASAMSSLTSHAEKLDVADMNLLASDLKSSLEKQGFTVKILDETINADKLKEFNDPNDKDTTYFEVKNYADLKTQLNVDYLALLNVTRLGFARPYQGFIPLAAPRAVVDIHGELIDLSNNQLVWYKNIQESSSVTGEWDEPPEFPGLTNSFYTALESAKQRVVNDIKPSSNTVASAPQTSQPAK